MKQQSIPNQGGALEYRRSIVARQLYKQPVTGELHVLGGDSTRYLNLAIDDGHHINGSLTPTEQGLAGHITYFEAALRGRGLGSRLLKVFTSELVAQGATELFSDTNTSAALRAEARVFGNGCLRFYDIDSPEAGLLPIDYDQALAINERVAQSREPGASVFDKPSNIGVYVDLSMVNTTEWERADITIFTPQSA